ncbi:MAG TPA: glycogen/starch/alpha-glucan phosphorylase, partial [Gallionellaceae bacterium]|nr:glycogen/starch/alpha-glucan phosphorylase [Gallionellaceae bacterium]
MSRPLDEISRLPPLGMDAASLVGDFRRYFSHTLARENAGQAAYYVYTSLALAVRDRLVERWKATLARYEADDCRRTCYLSLEFLMGRALGNALLNLELEPGLAEALQSLGVALEDMAELEHDAGLGNGGLGRLAACFLDSCATLQLPVTGYGLRYEYGMFRQKIENGYQLEEPDHWLRDGSPWEIERPEFSVRVHFGGQTEHLHGPDGIHRVFWKYTHDVMAVPFDVPVPGYRNDTVNTLRLWKAAATE